MKKLRALVLMHEDLVPPESLEGHGEGEFLEWKTEYDVITALDELDSVEAGLRDLGLPEERIWRLS